LFASSSEVYGFPKTFPTNEDVELSIPDPYNPRFSYSSSKIIGELLCINYSRKYNFKHTIVRYHNIYGPRMGYEHVMPQFIKKLTCDEKFIVEGDGTETRSFCYIDDAITATKIVHKDNTFDNRIFNIGNSEEVSISTLIEYLANISGRDITPEFQEKVNFGTKRRVPDISKAKSLGYEPKISLREGFEITYKWYNEHYSNQKNLL
jgi:nucleoside-diphosphate-sugar epimerase